MDVVVRTPHGDADIEIISAPDTTTLGDLLATVTGQAPPAVARVGTRVRGRVVSTSSRLDVVGLHVGCIIDSRPTETGTPVAPSAPPVVELLQLTGRGAGSIRPLSPGRYRVGAGRRLNAGELARAPVETTAFELEIRNSGDAFVTPGPRTGHAADFTSGALAPMLGDDAFDRTAAWSHGRLSTAGRAFELTEAIALGDDDRLQPDDRGTIPFQRTPVPSSDPDRPAVSAQRRAATPSRGLWGRRRHDDGAYALAFGLADDRGRGDATGIDGIVRLDLAAHRRCALVGAERFTAALARTLLVEAATLHGPSDLLIVVASTPERIGRWDWAKWLPHARGGDPHAVPLLLAGDDLSEWAVRSGEATNPAPPTLVLLDSVALWTSRESPLHRVVADPPDHLRLIARCTSPAEAPGGCTAIVEEQAPDPMHFRETREGAALVGSLARLRLTAPGGQTDDVPPQQHDLIEEIRPALVTSDAALEIALDLAPYDDLDVARSTVPGDTVQPPSISELIDLRTEAGVAPGLDVAIGLLDGRPSDRIGASPTPRRPARIDLGAAGTTLLSCDDREVHDTVLAALILSAAATHRSDRLAVLTVGSSQPSWHEEVPHLAGHIDRSSPDDPARLIHRVAHVIANDPSLEVLVVIEDAFTTSEPIHTNRGATPLELTRGILDLADSLSRVHVVMTTELPPDQIDSATRARCGVEVEFTGPTEHPRGTITDHDTRVAVLGPARTNTSERPSTSARDPRERGLRLAPCVHGRAMTPLERRVERLAKQRSDVVDDLTEAREVARRIADGAGDVAPTGSLLPPPLPTSVPLARLLDLHAGDGVPIGLVDRPETADSDAYWWQPGRNGSLLAVGSPRSGIADIIDLVIVGVATRLSPSDVRIHAIEPLPQRRRAFDALPHCVAVVSTDEPERAQRVIADVARLLGERRSVGRKPGDPDVVLTIGDLGRLRRWLADDAVSSTLEQLATIGADGPAHGINVVCVATRADDLGPVVRLAGDRLIGTLSDAADRRRLGVPTPGPADRHAGRCWSVDIERRVQLATPPDSVEAEIARLALPDRMPS